MPIDKNNPKIVKGKAYSKVGRPKGSVNKTTLQLKEYLDQKGFDLIGNLMTTIAQVEDPAQRAELLLKLMPYTQAKYRDRDYTEHKTIDAQAEEVKEKSTEELIKELTNKP